jgi:hypothetical protein
MKTTTTTPDIAASEGVETTAGDPLLPLLDRARTAAGGKAEGVVIGELVAIGGGGRMPLVVYGSQPEAAVAARSAIDLHAGHVGSQVVLVFEDGDPARPIILGALRREGWPLGGRPQQVEVDADGERLVVSAREQLVLRCGLASITLTKEGEVTIKGTQLSSQASGANRIKGGSVQLN